MRARLLAFSLAVAGVVAAACDDDPAPVASPPPPSSSSSTTSSGGINAVTPTSAHVTDYCEKTFGAIVAALDRCCSSSDKSTTDFKLTRDLAALVKPQCTLALAGSASAGKVLYRADRAIACYAAYESTYGPGKCEKVTETFSDPSGTACREAFIGTGQNGAKCFDDYECVDDLTCVGYTDSAEGLCSKPPALGQPCGMAKGDSSVTSEPVLRFGTHPSCAAGATCENGTCVTAKPEQTPDAEAPRKPAGAACTGGLLSTECAGRCAAPAGEPGTCATFCGSR